MTPGQAVLLASALATTFFTLLVAWLAWRAAQWRKATKQVQAMVDEARAWNVRAAAGIQPAAKVR